MKANQVVTTPIVTVPVTGNNVSSELKIEKQTIPVIIPVKSLEKEKNESVISSQEITPKKTLSIDELTERAEKLHLLKLKYEEIKEKRKQLQAFSISHDEKNAQLTIVDAKGERITTNSPTSISQVITIWADELDSHLSKNEMDMRSILEAFN